MLGICPQSKKHVHPSRGAAEAQLRELRQHRPDYAGHVYPCVHCGGYHVGREKKNAHKNKFRKGG